MGRRPPRCRRCDEPIEFGLNEGNDRRVPLNVGTDPTGSVVRTGHVLWDGTPIVQVFPNREVALASGLDKLLYSLHKETCQG